MSSMAGVELLASDRQPIEGSAAWCATMQICWNEMVDRLRGGSPLPVSVRGGSLARGLSLGGFDASMLSDDHYYAFSGPKTRAARREIERNISQRFHETSDVLDRVGWSKRPHRELLFYAMLSWAISFPVPFGDVDGELWDGSDDAEDEGPYFSCFGTGGEKPALVGRMREEVHPLYYADGEHHAVSVDTKEGDVVILQRSPETSTFAEMWEGLLARTAQATRDERKPLEEGETFICPYLFLDLQKDFRELVGTEAQGRGDSYRIAQAFQALRMRLDNTGGRVKSEAALLVAATGVPDFEMLARMRHFDYTGPFALYLVDGNAPLASRPYLALMVDDIRLFQEEQSH